MFYSCIFMSLTCSLAYRQPMEMWRRRWCVSSGGVTSQATLILWRTVMQVSRMMQKREEEHTRVISELTVGLFEKLHQHTSTLYIPRPLLSSIDLSIAKIDTWKNLIETICLCSRRVRGGVEAADALWRTKTPAQTQRTLPVSTVWIFTCHSHPVRMNTKAATAVAAFRTHFEGQHLAERRLDLKHVALILTCQRFFLTTTLLWTLLSAGGNVTSHFSTKQTSWWTTWTKT